MKESKRELVLGLLPVGEDSGGKWDEEVTADTVRKLWTWGVKKKKLKNKEKEKKKKKEAELPEQETATESDP